MIYEGYNNGLKEFTISGEIGQELSAELMRYLDQYDVNEVIVYYDSGDIFKYDVVKCLHLREVIPNA